MFFLCIFLGTKNRLTNSTSVSDFSTIKWLADNLNGPVPQFVKQKILIKHSINSALWLETGTYIGTTTKFLSHIGKRVITLEPSHFYYSIAQKNLHRLKNITFVFGSSEEYFDDLCRDINEPVNFWLDGHYSGEKTYKGALECPIVTELRSIEILISKKTKLVVFIDDFSCFKDSNKDDGDYPLKSTIVKWCEDNSLKWLIECDIFIASN
jgi:hypothetical protein